MEADHLGRDLNQFLPSNVLNDIDINAEENENNQFDEEEEVVDDLAYHLKPGTKRVTNQPIRFYSDSNVFISSRKNHQPLIQNSQSNVINYATLQYMYQMSNPLFSSNTPNMYSYMNNHIYNGMGSLLQNIHLERKKTDPYFFNEMISNQINNSYISHNSRKKTNSSSNFNAKTKTSTKSPKGSFDSCSMHFGRKLSEINVEKFEIEDFNNYIESLHCDAQEYVCSQKGSKEMQKYLNKSPSECRTILINLFNKSLIKVMIDKCGNYFCQQLFQTCSAAQLLLLINYIKNDVVKIAKNSSGTHALQALIDSFTSTEEEAAILSVIKGHETEMMYDNNATHVLQKIIININENNRPELTNAIIAHIVPLCYDPNGICVAKKMIKTTSSQSYKSIIIKSITHDCIDIAENAYGNYAIQYIFEEWNFADYPEMIKLLIDNIEALSIQKFSSNVIEKLIEYLDESRKRELFSKMFSSATVLRLLKMRYGKYVLQKAIKCMCIKQKNDFKKALLLAAANSATKESNKLESFIFYFDS